MIFQQIESLDSRIREIRIEGSIVTNIGLNLRGCGCRLLTINFEGMTPYAWEKKAEEVIGVVRSLDFAWDVIYLNSFPGMNLISRVNFRQFCPHCKENYHLDGEIGFGAKVFLPTSDGVYK